LESHSAQKIGKLLKELFPHFSIETEKFVYYEGQRLFFDFAVKEFNLFIEVDGEQHERFSPFFHGDPDRFRAFLERDRLKNEWAEKNDKILIRIRTGETDKMTAKQLLARIKEK